MSFILRYGTFLALILLCVLFSVLTITEQSPEGENAAHQVASKVKSRFKPGARVLIAARTNDADVAFANVLSANLESSGYLVEVVSGEATDARQALNQLVTDKKSLDAIACNEATSQWLLFANLDSVSPKLEQTQIVAANAYVWPNFLKTDNLLNIANQISVIAIIAVGMTFVIVAGGIDLSVGSLIALASVVSTILIRDHFGANQAGIPALILAAFVGIAVCAFVGLISGYNVVKLDIPPFIVTLAMMLIARGGARILADGQSVRNIPESFTWLGNKADFLGIPNSVILMVIVYIIAHFLLSKTVLGRHIYAVGGNQQAAFLSGVPVKKVIVFTYIAAGLLAGLGGIVQASRFQSGSPEYGKMDELYVIAAVVVGGTSLSGGRGTILGTLVGAFIIAVIRNGMNLTGVKPFTQEVILGVVILGAVMLDKVKYRVLSSPEI